MAFVSNCANCGVYKCYQPDVQAEYPSFCPHKKYVDIRSKSKELRNDNKNKRIEQVWEELMKDGRDETGYRWCRVKELIEFCKRMGYKKLGLAFCVGLKDEAKLLVDVLEKNGFDVSSVACMAGAEGKPVCDPIMQAEVLNQEATELNIMFGLCLGHDMLFIRYSKADVTPLVVKDRVLAHNPLGALYLSRQYYQKQLYL